MALIRHWPLNGNTNDYSGYGFNLTNFGASISADGKIGSSYLFSSSYMRTSTFQRTTGQEISVSAWFKQTNRTGYQQLVANRDAAGTYNWLLYFHTNDGSIQFHGANQNKSDDIPTLNQWNHVVATVDSAQVCKVYLNGNLVHTVTGFTYGPSGSSYIHIGASYSGAEYFAGNINDVRMYDHALSQLEIEELSRAKVLHYRFDGPEEEPTTNLAGNPSFIGGNHITQFSSAASYGTYSIVTLANPGGSPYVLRQLDGEYEMIFSSGLTTSTTYTMSCWVAYTNDWNGNNIVFHSRFFGTPANTSINGDPVGTLETKVVNGLTWNRVYATLTTPATTVTSLSWYLGYTGSNATTGWRYVTQIQLERKPYPTPFVDGTRNIGTIDSSGYGINGDTDATNTPIYTTTSKLGSGAMNINGSGGASASGGVINIPNSKAQINAGINNPFTFSLWLRPSGTATAAIIRKNGQFELYKTGSNFVYRTWNPSTNDVTSSATYSANNWYHLVATHDGVSTGKLYINGALDTTITRSGTPSSTTDTLGIGGYPTREWATDGIIDDFRFYGTELSATEVTALYNKRASFDNNGNIMAGEYVEIDDGGKLGVTASGQVKYESLSNVGIADSNLIGFWPLDGNTSDYSVNGYDGTPNNVTVTTGRGRYQAYLLTGSSSSRIYTATGSNLLNLSGAKQYTAMAWIYPELGGTTWHGVFSKGNSQQWALTVNSPSGYLHYETNQGGVGALDTSAGTIVANNWYHVAIRFNGTNKQIFINGSSAATQTATALNSASNTEELRIGEGNTGELFKGKIMFVKVFDRALTDIEIKIESEMFGNNKVKIQKDGEAFIQGTLYEGL
jgi:hypothetical protein